MELPIVAPNVVRIFCFKFFYGFNFLFKKGAHLDFIDNDAAYLIDTEYDNFESSLRSAMREIYLDKNVKLPNILKAREELQAKVDELPHQMLDSLNKGLLAD